jgi:hypothetical protein
MPLPPRSMPPWAQGPSARSSSLVEAVRLIYCSLSTRALAAPQHVAPSIQDRPRRHIGQVVDLVVSQVANLLSACLMGGLAVPGMEPCLYASLGTDVPTPPDRNKRLAIPTFPWALHSVYPGVSAVKQRSPRLTGNLGDLDARKIAPVLQVR